MNRPLFPVNPVLIVDDEMSVLKGFDLTLRSEGINHTLPVQRGTEVLPILSRKEIEVILLDISMPDIPGDALLEKITREYPHIPVIVITGIREVDMAVKCMKKNAFDYMVKPIETSRLTSGVKRAIELKRLYDENQLLKDPPERDSLETPEAFAQIITRNHKMKKLFRYAQSVAKSPLPLLITGETGVGKELMARAVHNASSLPGDFVSINVAGIDDTTFSDTLFGHVKGAFTGARSLRQGLIENASKGTLFLDEIGDLKEESQVKLLRLIQENEYFMLGSDVPKLMDTRIVAATNRDLKKQKIQGKFRKDLYYRISTHHIHIPPLCERLDDLPLLVDFLLDNAAHVYEKQKPDFSPELITLLKNYDFPGNVRELKGMVFDAVSTLKSKKLPMESFKQHIRKNHFNPEKHIKTSPLKPASIFENFSKLPTLAEAQLLLIQDALERTGQNKSMAADMLGISRQRLSRHLKSGNIE